MKRKLILAVWLILLLCGSVGAVPTTYYVCDTEVLCDAGTDPYCAAPDDWVTGNDANTGVTCAQAYKTIAKALSMVAAGDTIIVGDGTYTGATNMIAPTTSGTDGNRITIKAESEGGVLIDAELAVGRCPIKLLDVSYITVEGFNVQEAGLSTVAGLDSKAYCVYLGANSGSICQYNEVKKVIAWDTVIKTDNTAGGTIFRMDLRAYNNLFEDCAGWGYARKIFSLQSNSCQNNVIRRCFGMFSSWPNALTNGAYPTCAFEIDYSSIGNTLENCIGTYNLLTTSACPSCGYNGIIGNMGYNGYGNKYYGNITFTLPGQIFPYGVNNDNTPGQFYIGGTDITFVDNVSIYFGDTGVGKLGFYLNAREATGASWNAVNCTAVGAGFRRLNSTLDATKTVYVDDSVAINYYDWGYRGSTADNNYDLAYSNISGALTHSGTSPSPLYTNNPDFIGGAGNYLYASQVSGLAGKSSTGSYIGADLTYRYENGSKTTTLFDSFPMSARIKTALTASGYHIAGATDEYDDLNELLWGTAPAPSVGPYYVRQDGSAASLAAATGCGAAGTAMSIATLNGAVGAGLLPGDVVYLCDDGGTYTTGINIPASGDLTGDITFKAMDGDTVLFDCGSADQPIYGSGVSYITIDGNSAGGATLTLRDSMDAGIELTGCYEITIKDCTIGVTGDVNEEEGIYMAAVPAGKSFGQITNNTVSYNTTEGISIACAEDTDAEGGTISYNTINDNGSNGISVAYNDNVEVLFNYLSANNDAGVEIVGADTDDNANNIVIAWNFIDQSYAGANEDGIWINWGNGRIHGNIVTGKADADADASGISTTNTDGGSAYIYNNTIYNVEYGIWVGNASGGTGTVLLKNNIIQKTENDAIAITAAALGVGVTVDYNCVFAWDDDASGDGYIQWGANEYDTLAAFTTAVPAQCAFCKDSDPLFTAPTTNDFTISGAGGDCDNGGVDLGAPYDTAFHPTGIVYPYTIVSQYSYDDWEIGAYVYPPTPHEPAAYYVDATGGLDANTGTSETDAWQTIAKVNAADLIPGDTILFKRGETWAETLTVPSSGTENNTIYFGAYGTGADPIIKGSDVITGAWTHVPAVPVSPTYSDGFEAADADLTNGDGVFWTGGRDSANASLEGNDTSPIDSGTYSAVNIITAAGAEQSLTLKTIATPVNDNYVQFGLNVESMTGAAGNTATIMLLETTTAPRLRLTIVYVTASTYKLDLTYNTDGGTRTLTGTTVLNVGQWYNIEARYYVDAAAGGGEYWINLIQEGSRLDEDTSFASSQPNRITIGFTIGPVSTMTCTVNYDDYKYHTAYMGLPSDDLWTTSIITQPYQIFYNDTRATRKVSIAALTGNNQWYWFGNTLIYYLDSGDPSAVYTIEASARDYGITSDAKSYITIEGLKITECNKYGMNFSGGDTAGVTVQNNTVTSIFNRGISFTPSVDNKAFTDIVITGNTVSSIGGNGIYCNGDTAIRNFTGTISDNDVSYACLFSNASPNTELGTSAGGILLYGIGVINSVIEGNESHHNGIGVGAGYGVGIWNDTVGAGNVIRKNKCYSNGRSGIMVEVSSDTDVYYNIAYSNGYNGIGIFRSTVANPSDNNEVYNNTAYLNDGPAGIWCSNYGGTHPMDGNTFKNNISVGNVNYQLSAEYGGDNSAAAGLNGGGANMVYEYNCFGAPTAAHFIEWGDTVDKDTVAAFELAYGGASNTIDSDPLLAKPGSGDMRIAKNSPCKDVGSTITGAPDTCYCGNKVPIGACTDIGACEWKEETNIFKEIMHGLGLWF